MRYVSTRGEAAPRSFEAVLLAGLAEDGGLFLPETWPTLAPAECAPLYVLLASQESSYITGETFGVTGGNPLP